MDRRFRSPTTVFLAIAFLLAAHGRSDAQDLDRVTEPAMVTAVDLITPRMDGPSVLILSTAAGKVRLADGIYRSKDRVSLVVKNAQIIEVRGAGTEGSSGGFRVSQIEKVAVRHFDSPAGIYLRDSRGRTMALPDGRFTSESGLTLVVTKSTVTAYGQGR